MGRAEKIKLISQYKTKEDIKKEAEEITRKLTQSTNSQLALFGITLNSIMNKHKFEVNFKND